MPLLLSPRRGEAEQTRLASRDLSGQTRAMGESAEQLGHGRLMCGTVLAPAFDLSLADYCRELALEIVDEGLVPEALAACWGAPAMAGRRFALLRGQDATPGFLRLVEGSVVEGHRPLATFGWVAFECSVRDAFALHDRIDKAAFRVLGAPRLVPGFDNFIPFQVAGRAGEALYLNTVLKASMADLDLPHAQAEVDRMFIAVLAAADREESLAFQRDVLGLEEGQTWVIPYSMINQSFGLPDDHPTAMTMTKVGRLPVAEIDQYPQMAEPRRMTAGELPPGNAMVSLAVRDLDAIPAPLLGPPVNPAGPLYGGRRAAVVRGPEGARFELLECA
jgi:catechol 2,3-dioxygenase-like lactoylglutathione lyase family enzyme